MGGSFSAQSVDLRSCWAVYQGRKLLRSLGEPRFTESNFPFWATHGGVMTMCQLRDNILVASSYPDSDRVQLIHAVCRLLGSAWNVKVSCDCQPEHPTCQFTCLETHTMAMGFSLVRGPGGRAWRTYTPMP